MVPTHMFLTRGVGVHKEKLASFEQALRGAGVAYCNLVSVSSIMPPNCTIVPRKRGETLLNPGEINEFPFFSFLYGDLHPHVMALPITVLMLGIGLAMGGWAKNERQVAPLSQIVVFPMMFLSGTFWPRFMMPETLQKVSDFLPLTPVIDGIRLIAAEGQHLTQILPQVGMVAGWLIIVYLLAFRFFRWE
jgi:uncharacterized membrane protein